MKSFKDYNDVELYLKCFRITSSRFFDESLGFAMERLKRKSDLEGARD
jgi:hypothetical protein